MSPPSVEGGIDAKMMETRVCDFFLSFLLVSNEGWLQTDLVKIGS